MSVPTEAPEIFFNGVDGNECEAFVFAIQKHAFEIGRDEDYNWMLRFARTCLKAKALRWYARLDPSIKKEWDLFVQALFDEYPQVGEPSETEIATPVWSAITFSPSASTATLPQTTENQAHAFLHQGLDIPRGPRGYPSAARAFDPSSNGQQIGLLRIVNEENTSLTQYIWWGSSDDPRSTNFDYGTRTTVHRHEALVVSFLPTTEPHQIGLMNNRTKQAILSVVYTSGLAVESYGVVGSNWGAIAPSADTMNGSHMTKIWTVLADGTLQMSLSSFSRSLSYGPYEETKFTTTDVHLNTSGDQIRFVKAGTALEQDKPDGKPFLPFIRARIVFEPL